MKGLKLLNNLLLYYYNRGILKELKLQEETAYGKFKIQIQEKNDYGGAFP